MKIASFQIPPPPEKAIIEKGTINNGRFQFSSKDALSNTTIEGFKEKGEENLANAFEKHYKSGFRSLKPIVNPSNESLLSQMEEETRARTILRMSKESEDVLNDIIEEELYIL